MHGLVIIFSILPVCSSPPFTIKTQCIVKFFTSDSVCVPRFRNTIGHLPTPACQVMILSWNSHLNLYYLTTDIKYTHNIHWISSFDGLLCTPNKSKCTDVAMGKLALLIRSRISLIFSAKFITDINQKHKNTIKINRYEICIKIL
jgi:hypothetical protein